MAKLELDLGHAKQAQALDLEAIEISLRGKRRTASTVPFRIWAEMVRKYIYAGHYQIALELSKQAFDLARIMETSTSETGALLRHADIYLSIAQHRAFETLKKQNPELKFSEVGAFLSGRPLSQDWVRDHRRALALLEQALRINRASGDTDEVAERLAKIGEVHGLLGDPAREEAMLRRAFEWAEGHGWRVQALNLLERLADWHKARNHHREALVHYQRLVNHHRSTYSTCGASIEDKIAEVQEQMGQGELARQHTKRSQDLQLQTHPASTLQLMARRALHEGDFDRADELFDQAVAAEGNKAVPAGL
jgi:tetratricopeptide (TPR) repeat protein